jgi:hypothetical protein
VGELDAPASRVRALLEGVFGPVTAIGDGFVAQRRDCLATGAALTPDRLSGMREIIWRRRGGPTSTARTSTSHAPTGTWSR